MIRGNRVFLIHMDDPYTKLKYGDMGTIDFIDDAGSIHVKWDNGSNLALLSSHDEFRIITITEERKLKLKKINKEK